MRASSEASQTSALEVVRLAADSLLARHEAMPTRRMGVAVGDPGAAFPDGPRRRRSLGRRWAARCLRGHARRALPARRGGGRRLPARCRRAGLGRLALAGLGRPRRAAFGDALHELRRRGGRDQRLPPPAVQRHGRAALSHRCTCRHALARCAGGRGRPARRARAPGAGRTTRPTSSRTTASAWASRGSCSPSTRSPTPPATARGGRTPGRGLHDCARSPGTDAGRCRRGPSTRTCSRPGS